MVATSTRRWHPRFGVSLQSVYADSLMPRDPPDRIIRQMWTVTTTGELGLNAKQVQVWLGHHSPAFTVATYVHLLAEDLPASPFGGADNGWAPPREAAEAVAQVEAAKSR